MVLKGADAASLAFAALPTLLIFLVGRAFPMDSDTYSPVFEPPGWTFGVIWSYLTVAFGVVSVSAMRHKGATTIRGIRSRYVVAAFYVSILAGLVAWLPIFYYRKYAASFGLLLGLTVLSVLYVMWLSYIRCGCTFALVPLCAWLTVAACLNAAIYDRASSA